MPRRVVWIDNGAWDWLCDQQIDLLAELPSEEFELAITRQVEIEMRRIKRPEVREYAQAMIAECRIEVCRVFGFDREGVTDEMRRYGGFDEGVWASTAELDYIREQNSKREQAKEQGSGLYQHEADIALAAKSFDGVVITAERRGGPLSDAEVAGGHVVRLYQLAERGQSLREACSSAGTKPAEPGRQ